MVGTIIGRTYKNDAGNVKLSLRIKTPTINNAVSLDISVDQDNWFILNKSMKYYAKAYRRGSDFEVDGGLKSRLWSLLKSIDALNEAGTLTLDTARQAVKDVLRKSSVEEMERMQQSVEDGARDMTLTEWAEKYVAQLASGERLKRKSARAVVPGSVRNYQGTLNQLLAYQQKRHRVLGFEDVTLDFYDDWRQFLLSRSYSPNTIARHIKNLKTFLYAAKDMKLTTVTDFESSRFSVDYVEVENVYLTEERVQEMYDTDFEDAKTVARLLKRAPDLVERTALEELLGRRKAPRLLNEAKDIFVVGCLTGQRVSDYKRINAGMIRQLSDGNDYIYLQQEKTEKWIYIPLDVRVRTILGKYGGKLPKVYDQDLNERIKMIGRLLGWRENAGITEYRGMMQVPTQKKFYECIKTHTARRTFATNAYKHKISLSSIMIITGHGSEKMLRKYLKLDNEERAMLAAAEFSKAREVRLKVAE